MSLPLHPALDMAARASVAEIEGHWTEAAQLWFAAAALTECDPMRDRRRERGSSAATRAAGGAR